MLGNEINGETHVNWERELLERNILRREILKLDSSVYGLNQSVSQSLSRGLTNIELCGLRVSSNHVILWPYKLLRYYHILNYLDALKCGKTELEIGFQVGKWSKCSKGSK